VLLASNEALEVRELRRSAADTLQLREPDDRRNDMGMVLKWRRDNMQVGSRRLSPRRHCRYQSRARTVVSQVTAAAFIAQGNMLVVSDRGDR
jgi:hypothetical protein